MWEREAHIELMWEREAHIELMWEREAHIESEPKPKPVIY